MPSLTFRLLLILSLSGFLLAVNAQTFPGINIEIEQDSINELESHPYTNEDVIGSFVVDGLRTESVELHYRGAYNLWSLIRKGSIRNWKVKFEKTEMYENRREWNFNYEKYIRQNLSYQLFKEAGVPCVSAENVVLSVNGVRQGIYLKYEDPDNKTWLADEFGDDEGDLFKAAYDMPDEEKFFADLTWLGDQDEDYFLHYRKQTNKKGEKEFDYSSLIEFIDFVNHSSDEVFAREIEHRFAMGPFIRYLVVSNYIANWDSYPFRPKNYFLYQNPSDSLWSYIPWDLDGTFQEVGTGRNPIGTTGSVFHYFDGIDPYDNTPTEPLDRPLVWRIMAIEKYRKQYLWEYQQALGSYLSEDWLKGKSDSILANVAANATSSELNDYNGDVSMVKSFIDARVVNVNEELAQYEIENPYVVHYPYSDPENLGSWALNEDLSDEFDGGALNGDKWIIQGANGEYQNNFKGRAPSQFVPDMVGMDTGYFSITSKWDSTFTFLDESMGGYKYGEDAPITTGAIISRSTFLYGYMEIRCKAADGPISSAFWTTGSGGELDVFEHYGKNPAKENVGKKYHTSFHDWRSGSESFGQRIWTNEHIMDFRVADDFHIYGLEWQPDYIRIFVDGTLVRCVSRDQIGDAWVLSNPQKVWLDSETFNWQVKPENMTVDDFPGDGRNYIVDYVRIWQNEDEGEKCTKGENLIVNPGLENGLDAWTAGGAAIAVSDNTYEGEGAVKLNGQGSLEQIMNLKANTNYILSAWIKLPGTNMSNIWHNALLGVKGYGSEEVSVQFFRPGYTYQSIQFKTGAAYTQATVFFRNTNASHLAYADNFSLVESRDLHENPYVEVSGVELDQDSLLLYADSTFMLTASILPGNADQQMLQWLSADTAIASVDASGMLVGRDSGMVLITVSSLEGGYSDSCVVSVLKHDVTGQDASAMLTCLIYPNPASEVLHISAPGVSRIHIYTSMGRLVLSEEKKGEPFQLLVSELPSGIYIITLFAENSIATRKLLVE